MSPRIPSIARKERDDQDDDQPKKEVFLEQARLRLARELLEQATPRITGRPPRSETEKREAYQSLAMLRNARLTYEECAHKLGVSVSTVRNYIADPLYQEVQQELVQQTRVAGFVSVGALVQDAIATMVELMAGAKSEFVRYKAAEQITRLAGMEEPQLALQPDDSRDISRILEAIRLREQPQSPVQVTINVSDQQQLSSTVESDLFTPSEEGEPGVEEEESLLSLIERRQLAEQQRLMRAEYDQPMLPGGRLPGSVEPK